MNRLVALILALAVLGAACGNEGPEDAGESVPRVSQPQDRTDAGN